MKISELITDKPVIIEGNESLNRLVKLMDETSTECLPVVENGRLIGLVTDKDVLHAVAKGCDLLEMHVSDIMNRDVTCVFEDCPADYASILIEQNGAGHLVVLGNMSIKGVVNGDIAQREIPRI